MVAEVADVLDDDVDRRFPTVKDLQRRQQGNRSPVEKMASLVCSLDNAMSRWPALPNRVSILFQLTC